MFLVFACCWEVALWKARHNEETPESRSQASFPDRIANILPWESRLIQSLSKWECHSQNGLWHDHAELQVLVVLINVKSTHYHSGMFPALCQWGEQGWEGFQPGCQASGGSAHFCNLYIFQASFLKFVAGNKNKSISGVLILWLFCNICN